MKSLVLFFFVLGIILIIVGQYQGRGPPPRVEYRYIPKNFTEEQYERMPILATYGKLFTHSDPWQKSIGYPGVYYDKKEEF